MRSITKQRFCENSLTKMRIPFHFFQDSQKITKYQKIKETREHRIVIKMSTKIAVKALVYSTNGILVPPQIGQADTDDDC